MDTCRNPRCHRKAKRNSKWCRPCEERLSRVKLALEEEQRRAKSITVSRRCRADGCTEYRQRSSPFCPLHEHLEVE